MNNWKVIFATVVIFGSGVITGGLLVNYVHHSSPRHDRAAVKVSVARPTTNKKIRPPEILSKQFLQQLDEKLDLTPDQRKAAQKSISEGQDLIRKVIEDARLEIRSILTPEQRRQFDELIKRPFRKPIYDGSTTANGSPPVKAP